MPTAFTTTIHFFSPWLVFERDRCNALFTALPLRLSVSFILAPYLSILKKKKTKEDSKERKKKKKKKKKEE